MLGQWGSMTDFSKDIIIDVYNDARQLVLSHKDHLWVSDYQNIPELDANANTVAINRIKLDNEGCEWDYEVSEPDEPFYTESSYAPIRKHVACKEVYSRQPRMASMVEYSPV